MSKAFAPKDVASMVAFYECGMSASRIAGRFGTDTSTICRRLKAAGITLRTQSESRIVHRCDAAAFDRHDAESAYWLGFLLADGCIVGGRRFALSVALKASDRMHLEQFREFLRAETPIRFDAKRNAVCLVVSSEELIRSLAAKGCTPQKSHRLEFPQSGLFYRPHFVRGVFDGDGSITAIKRPYIQPTVSFVGSEPFLLGLQDVICSDAGLARNKLYSAGRSEVARTLSWTGTGNASKLGRYLYKQDGPRLERKKARFEELGLYRTS
jgi:hypothetical protein